MKTMKYREYRQYEGVDFRLPRSVAKEFMLLATSGSCEEILPDVFAYFHTVDCTHVYFCGHKS